MKHILLVEDDLSMLNGLSFAIKKQGYALDIARIRDEQKQLWTEDKYDLVILDVSLPDGSGFDICQEIRNPEEVPSPRPERSPSRFPVLLCVPETRRKTGLSQESS